jgi:hypothetical protein
MAEASSGAQTLIPFTLAREHTLPMPALLSIRRGAVRAQAGLCAGTSLIGRAQTATGRCNSMRLSKPIRRRSGCGAPSDLRSLPLCRKPFVTRYTDTSVYISCTSGSENEQTCSFRHVSEVSQPLAGANVSALLAGGGIEFGHQVSGIRPRSFTSMSCALAHSRTSVVSRPPADPCRPPTRPAALTHQAGASAIAWVSEYDSIRRLHAAAMAGLLALVMLCGASVAGFVSRTR